MKLVVKIFVLEQVLTCGGAKAAAATYSGPANRNFLVIHWKAPMVDLPKTYKFLFTVVEKESTFWVENVANSEVKVGNEKASFCE